MPSMTRARPTSYGVVTPPPLHRWMHAVLMLVVCLVQGVGATFRMRFNRRPHDWHMGAAQEALPQTKPDIHLKDPATPTESCSGLSRASLLANPKGLANDPLETRNQDSRDKPENDPVDTEALEAGPLARVPGAGRDPASAQRALPTRTSPLAVIAAKARSRASGMTPSMCVQTSPF